MTLITGLHKTNRRKRTTFHAGKATAQRRRFRAAFGFTLLELVLVMVILCTVLAMAAPSLRGFFASRTASDAAAQILALTQLARTQAIADGCVYRLNIDVQQKAYWLTAQTQGAFTELGNEFGRVFSLPQDIVIELESFNAHGAAQCIEFSPQGRTQVCTIRLSDLWGNIFEITCLSPTETFRVIVPEQI